VHQKKGDLGLDKNYSLPFLKAEMKDYWGKSSMVGFGFLGI